MLWLIRAMVAALAWCLATSAAMTAPLGPGDLEAVAAVSARAQALDTEINTELFSRSKPTEGLPFACWMMLSNKATATYQALDRLLPAVMILTVLKEHDDIALATDIVRKQSVPTMELMKDSRPNTERFLEDCRPQTDLQNYGDRLISVLVDAEAALTAVNRKLGPPNRLPR